MPGEKGAVPRGGVAGGPRAAHGDRLWPGREAAPSAVAFLWLEADPGTRPIVVVEASTPYAVATSTADPGAAGVPPGSAPRPYRGLAEVAALIPAGTGLLLDPGTPRATAARPADVDALRPGPLPHGGEPEIVIAGAPGHLIPLIAEARVTGRRVGAQDVRAAWAAFPNGKAALVVMVKVAGNLAADAILDTVYEVVERHAPVEPVRVVADTGLPASRVPQIDSARTIGGSGRATGVTKPTARPPAVRGRTPGNRGLAVTGGILGAVLIGLPHRTSMPGWAAAAVVTVGVLIVVGFVGAALRDFFQREP